MRFSLYDCSQSPTFDSAPLTSLSHITNLSSICDINNSSPIQPVLAEESDQIFLSLSNHKYSDLKTYVSCCCIASQFSFTLIFSCYRILICLFHLLLCRYSQLMIHLVSAALWRPSAEVMRWVLCTVTLWTCLYLIFFSSFYTTPSVLKLATRKKSNFEWLNLVAC